MTEKLELIWGNGTATWGRYLVERRVVRIGTSPESDIVLNEATMSPNVLSVNFSEGIATAYPRSGDVESIGSDSAVINQGVTLKIGERITLVGGVWIELSRAKASSPPAVQKRRESSSAPALAVPPVREKTIEVKSPPSKSATKSNSLLIPIILCVVILAGLAAVVIVKRQQNAASNGASRVSLSTLVNELAETKDAELKQVRAEVLKAWQVPNGSEAYGQHLTNARNILIHRLGQDILSTKVDMSPREEFDRQSELQLFVLLSNAVQ